MDKQGCCIEGYKGAPLRFIQGGCRVAEVKKRQVHFSEQANKTTLRGILVCHLDDFRSTCQHDTENIFRAQHAQHPGRASADDRAAYLPCGGRQPDTVPGIRAGRGIFF
jgi:hypothetical protein